MMITAIIIIIIIIIVFRKYKQITQSVGLLKKKKMTFLFSNYTFIIIFHYFTCRSNSVVDLRR